MPRRWPRRIALGVLIFVPLVVFLGFGMLWLTVPPDNLTLHVRGLTAPAEITFDGNGVPRIHAANERDAAIALGFAHARDRMFQMELMRRAASGRLSELIGPATLPIDKQMRVLGLGRLAEDDVAAQSPEVRAVLEAYATGVNAWIADRGRFAGLEFLYFGVPAPWSASDSMLWGRTMGMWLSMNYRNELLRQSLSDKVSPDVLKQLWPMPPTAPRPDARLTAPGAPDVRYATAAKSLLAALPAFPAPFTLPSQASNEWAVDGRFSETGAPLLAGDPHLSFGFPGLWYLARIEYPGHVLVGATAPGVPFLVMGHNGRVAWSFTTTGADTQDVYLEPPDATFTSREERIKVRGQPDVVLTVRATRHGPVISDLNPGAGPIMAVAMENLQPRDTAATGLWTLNQARSVEEAGKVAPLISSPVQNLLVADKGKIGLFVTGRVPIRRAGDGWAPVPGGPPVRAATGDTGQTTALPTPGSQTSGAPTSGAPTSGTSPPGAPAPGAPTHGAPIPGSPTQTPPARTAPGSTGSGLTGPASAAPAPIGSMPAALTSAGATAASPTAADDPYGWIGYATGEQLPHYIAPPSGRLVNANEPVAGADFPVFMGLDQYRDWRARRIRALLDASPKFSSSDFAAMQVDAVSTYAAALLPMLRVVQGAPQVLRDWDGAMTENAPQPLIFSAWMQAFQRAVLAKRGLTPYDSAPVFEFVPFVLSPDGASWCGGDCGPLLKSTLESTMSSLAARFGPDPSTWRWGTVHQAVFAHPLFQSIPLLGALTTSRISVPGDGTTLDQGGMDAALESVHGASYRGVYDLANLDRSLFIMAPGQSGNPLSRHARDFLTRWRDGAMVLLGQQPVGVSGVIRLEP